MMSHAQHAHEGAREFALAHQLAEDHKDPERVNAAVAAGQYHLLMAIYLLLLSRR